MFSVSVHASLPPGYSDGSDDITIEDNGTALTGLNDGSVYYKDKLIPKGERITEYINVDLVITINKPFEKFLKLLANGTELEGDVNYKISRSEYGSTILTIYADTLAKLGLGEHDFLAVFDDADIDVLTSIIGEAAKPDDKDKEDATDKIPDKVTQTGDSMLLLIVIAGASLASAAAAVVGTSIAGKNKSKVK